MSTPWQPCHKHLHLRSRVCAGLTGDETDVNSWLKLCCESSLNRDASEDERSNELLLSSIVIVALLSSPLKMDWGELATVVQLGHKADEHVGPLVEVQGEYLGGSDLWNRL